MKSMEVVRHKIASQNKLVFQEITLLNQILSMNFFLINL